ncbi:MAG: amidohydrolase family protein [Gracilimonas sp.]|uniref:amidohydrolase family protein n=1 Tax=Gracilimonas sp. TaxID=1974203 RepID=UPI0019A92946|nr:amidohydrolase family protein [Gracilimonas sp.]MBD3617107.1 amidohydrolase family protein [Gracilimonas sp.]
MKTIKPALILSSLLLLASGLVTAQPIVFTNVTIIDVEEGVAMPGMSVIVTGERITAVGTLNEIKVSDGATTIDGRGKYLIPGLWDMHIHNVNDVYKPVPWDFHTPDPEGAEQREIYMPIYLAFGVTGTRELSGGLESIELRKRIEAGEILGPHMVIGSPLLDGPIPIFPDAAVMRIDGPERARNVVTKLHSQGFDFLKPYSLLSAESYRALHERARELEMEVAGEIPISVSLWEAAELGQRSVEHLTGVEFACSNREEELRAHYVSRLRDLNTDPSSEGALDIWNRSEWEPFESLDPERCRKLYGHLAAHGTWVVPTLIIQKMISHANDPRWANNPNFRYTWPMDLEALADEFDPERRLRPLHDYRMSVINELHDAGVGVLAGSDVSGGFTLHQELEIFVESGMTPLDALRTATINPARYLGRENDLGSITPGKIADLVLLNKNPLDDIRNTQSIEAVVFRGHLLDRPNLDRILRQLEVEANHLKD